MHDWKLSPLVLVTLPDSWAYRESRRSRSPKPQARWRALVRRGDATGCQNAQPERDRVTPSKDPTDVPPSRDVQAIPDPYRDTSAKDGVIDGPR
jgi:hypothetical protein